MQLPHANANTYHLLRAYPRTVTCTSTQQGTRADLCDIETNVKPQDKDYKASYPNPSTQLH